MHVYAHIGKHIYVILDHLHKCRSLQIENGVDMGHLDPSDPNNPRCVGYDGRCIPIPGISNFIAPLMVHTWGRFTALWINIIKHPCMFLKEFDLRQLSVQQKVMWWQS